MTVIVAMTIAREDVDRGRLHEPTRATTEQAMSRSQNEMRADQGSSAVQPNFRLHPHHASPWWLGEIHRLAHRNRAETWQHGQGDDLGLARSQ